MDKLIRNIPNIVAATLILSFGLFVLLGSLGFGIMAEGGMHACPISDMTGNDCSTNNEFSAVLNHISGLNSLLLLIVSFSIAVLFLFWQAESKQNDFDYQNINFFKFTKTRKKLGDNISFRNIMRWLATLSQKYFYAKTAGV